MHTSSTPVCLFAKQRQVDGGGDGGGQGIRGLSLAGGSVSKTILFLLLLRKYLIKATATICESLTMYLLVLSPLYASLTCVWSSSPCPTPRPAPASLLSSSGRLLRHLPLMLLPPLPSSHRHHRRRPTPNPRFTTTWTQKQDCKRWARGRHDRVKWLNALLPLAPLSVQIGQLLLVKKRFYCCERKRKGRESYRE